MNDIAPEPQVAQVAAPREGAGILQVVPRLDEGGVERGACDLARFLAAEGWRALVASAGGPLQADLEASGATHLHLALETKNPLTLSANIGRLQRLIREQRVQLVHARSRAPAWSAYHAARRCPGLRPAPRAR